MQLVDRLLAQVIQLAHRKEEPGRERRDVERAEHERRLAEAAELFAQRVGVERALASPATSVISLRTVTVSPSAVNTALSGAPAAPNSANVEPRLLRAQLRRQRRRSSRARARAARPRDVRTTRQPARHARARLRSPDA